MLSDRQSFYLANEAEREHRRGGGGVHAAVLRRPHLDPGAAGRPAGAGRTRRRSPRRSRGARRPGRAARRRARREAPDPGARRAQRAARARAGAAARRAPPPAAAPRRSRACSTALSLDALPVRIECFDISNLGGTHTVASMVVFEGGAPKKSDYRRFKIRTVERPRRLRLDGGGARPPLSAGGSARPTSLRTIRRYDASFAALPNVVVIDGGKGQLARGSGAAGGFRERGVAVISLAKRLEEVFMPGRSEPSATRSLEPRAAAAGSVSATRRTASRSPTIAADATAR